MLVINKGIKRYTTYDDGTFDRLIKVIKKMTAYSLDSGVSKKMTDVYFDNGDHILEKNNLLLRKRVMGKRAELKLMRLHFEEQFYFMDKLRQKEREKEIGATDPLSKHYFFLNGALNSMYSSSLQFDPDKLFEQMEVVLSMDIEKETRNLLGFGGLKLEIQCDKMKFLNHTTKRKNKISLIEFKLLSDEDTLPYFDEFVSKVEKLFKEIFSTDENKFELAYRMTKPLPSKEEQNKRIAELQEASRLSQSGLTTEKK